MTEADSAPTNPTNSEKSESGIADFPDSGKTEFAGSGEPYSPHEPTRYDSTLNILITATALSALSVVLTQLIFPAHFEAVDDLNFSLLLSGVGLTHAPTYQTWFTNFLVTSPLMWLYQWQPDCPWYSIYLFTALTAGLAMIAFALMLRFKRKLGAILYLIYFFIAGIFIVNGLQYTSTTAVIAQSAFLLGFCLPITDRFQNKLPVWLMLTSALAAVFASMIRFEPFLLVLLISSITVAVILPGRVQIFTKHRKPIICLVAALCIGFSLKQASNYYYDSQPGFAGIREFFKPFSDIADSDRIMPTGATNSLSNNDYLLVKQFFVADKDVFTTQSLSSAVAASSVPMTERKLQWTLNNSIITLLVFVAMVAWLLDERIMSKPRLLLWLTGMTALILYLSFFMKLPPRVNLTLLTCAVTTLFMFLDKQKIFDLNEKYWNLKAFNRRSIITVISVLAAMVLREPLTAMFLDANLYRAESEQIKTTIEKLAPTRQQLYVVLGTTAPYQFFRPFENLRPYFKNFDIYRTSLWGRVPAGTEMLKAHGFNNLRDACQSPNVFFISNKESNALFSTFCKEHYNLTTQFQLVFSEPTLELEIYKLSVNQPSI